MIHWRAIAFAAAGLCVFPATAAAQTPNNEARAAFQDGVRQYSAHQYAGALEAFRTAYRVRPHPSVLVNIANCQLALNQPHQALATFERYLTDAAPTLAPEQRAEIERAMAEARRHLATLNVVVQPPGAEVYLDGDLVGTAPLRRPIETGRGPHVLEARMAGLPSQQYQARVEGGGSVTVTLDLAAGRVISGSEPVALPAPTSGSAAALAAAGMTPPVATVSAGVTGVPGPAVPGPVRVVVPAPAVVAPVPVPVVAPTPVVSVDPVVPVGGQTVAPTPLPPPQHHGGIPIAVWIGGGVTLVAAGLAIGFAVYADSETADYNNLVTQRNYDISLLSGQVPGQPRPTGAYRAQLLNDVNTLGQRGVAISASYDNNHTLSLVFGGVAAAGGLFTVGALLFWPRGESTPTPAVAGIQGLRLLPTLDGRGVILGGAF